MTLKGTVWAPVGPSPMLKGTLSANGTTTAIAVNPNNSNIIYQGTAGGGVWRSVDGGVTWTALFDRQFSLGIGEPGAIAIDPNNSDTIYVGTSGRTITGAAFETIQQSFPGGDGLFKSMDGGASWIQLGSGFPDENNGNADQFVGQWINVIIVDPADGNTLYLASNRGVFVSLDGGQNWLVGNNVAGDAVSLVLDTSSPATSRILYTGVSGVGVLRSTDGGQNWTQILNNTTSQVAAAMTAGGFTSINKVIVAIAPAASPPNTNGIQVLYVALQGAGPTFGQPDVIGLFLSTNHGGSWTKLPATGIPSVTYSGYTFNMDIDPASPGDGVNDIIYFGTRNQAKSTNSGNSFGAPFTNLHADTHSLAFFAGPTPSIVYFGTDGGLYRSTNGGSMWDSLSTGGLQTGVFYNIDVKPDTTASVTVGALQDNGLQTNKGAVGLAWQSGQGGDGFDVAFDTGTPPQVYASANASGPPNTVVLRSNPPPNDDGVAYTDITMNLWGTSGEGALPSFLAPVTTDPNTALNVYVSGRNNLWQSTNGGVNWRILRSFVNTGNVDVARNNSNNVVIAVNQQVFVSTNALSPTVGPPTGVTFTDITRNLPSRNVIRAVFDPNDPAVIYAVLGGLNGVGPGQSGHVFRTTVNSASWTDISPPLDLPFSAIALDGTDVPTAIYVGTDFGVLRSVDGGLSWSVLDDIHFPHGAPVTDLVLKQISGVLTAATYGRGVFQFVRPTGPAIAVNPQQGLVFGDIGAGPAYLTLEVFNVGAADLIIDSVQRLMGSNGFTMLQAPSTPLAIMPGNHVDFTIRYIPTATSCSQETALIRISSNDPSAHFVDLLATGTGRVPISQIIAHIETGNQDPDRNTRVFLGFDGKHGREFRMRTTDDANPFRQSTALDIVFGSGANVRDEDINDPTQPQMDQNRITGAYIRIEPGQEKPWEIASAQVFINGSGTPMFSLKLPNIVLEEDAGEKVSLG